MIDIPALLRSQPISGLAPQWIAIIKGLDEEATSERLDPDIWLLEPPAGQHVPFVDPVKTMEIMFRHQGAEPGEAANRAVIEYAKLRLRLRIYEHVRFFDLFDPEPPECIPVPVLTAYLEEKKLVAATVIDFLNRAVDAVTHASIFRGPDNWNNPWTLAELPNLPTAQAMIEFIPGPLGMSQWVKANMKWTPLFPYGERRCVLSQIAWRKLWASQFITSVIRIPTTTTTTFTGSWFCIGAAPIGRSRPT